MSLFWLRTGQGKNFSFCKYIKFLSVLLKCFRDLHFCNLDSIIFHHTQRRSSPNPIYNNQHACNLWPSLCTTCTCKLFFYLVLTARNNFYRSLSTVSLRYWFPVAALHVPVLLSVNFMEGFNFYACVRFVTSHLFSFSCQ